MENKVFNLNDIYDLLNADHAAYSLHEETGYQSGWYDFASEEDYKIQFALLGDNDKKFEKQLRETTLLVKDEFKELEELDFDDFDTEEEFMNERKNIQDNILSIAHEKLKDYIKS